MCYERVGRSSFDEVRFADHHSGDSCHLPQHDASRRPPPGHAQRATLNTRSSITRRRSSLDEPDPEEASALDSAGVVQVSAVGFCSPPPPPTTHHSTGAPFPHTPPSLRPCVTNRAGSRRSVAEHLSLRARWRPGGLSTTPPPPPSFVPPSASFSSAPPPLRRNSRPPSCDHLAPHQRQVQQKAATGVREHGGGWRAPRHPPSYSTFVPLWYTCMHPPTISGICKASTRVRAPGGRERAAPPPSPEQGVGGGALFALVGRACSVDLRSKLRPALTQTNAK